MKRTVYRGLALAAAGALAITACGGGSSTPNASSSSSGGSGGGNGSGSVPKYDIWSSGLSGDPNTVNSATVKQGGKVTYVSEKDFNSGWNLNTSASNIFELGEIDELYHPNAFIDQPDLTSFKLDSNWLDSADQTKSSPQTIVYKIKQSAKWSDGQPISADDFVYFWQAQNGKDCPDCDILGTTGYDQIQSVTGSDNGKTVTVTYSKPFPDWKALFGAGYGLLPAHVAKAQGWQSGNAASLAKTWNDYFVKNVPKVSGGPYVIQSYTPNQAVVLVPNPGYYGPKPKLDQLVVRIITDSTQEPTAFQNGEVDAMYPQPETDLFNQIKGMQNAAYQLDAGLQFEHFDYNLNNTFLKDKALRAAMFTAVDVKGLLARTVGQFDPKAPQDGNLIFVPAQTSFYQDHVTGTGFGTGDATKAKKILTDAGYKNVGQVGKLQTPDGKTVPSFRMRFTQGNAIRQTECELFSAAAKQVGIDVKVEPTDSLGKSLGTGGFKPKNDPQHAYDIIVFAYVGGPNFVSGDSPIYHSGSGGNLLAYSNKQVDNLLDQAAVGTDTSKNADLMNQADKIIIGDAVSLPLYEKPGFLVYNPNIGNIRNNGTQLGPTYNAGEWGHKTVS